MSKLDQKKIAAEHATYLRAIHSMTAYGHDERYIFNAGIAHANKEINSQAQAWRGVTDLLDVLDPSWLEEEGSGLECALRSIEKLALKNGHIDKPIIEWDKT